MAVNAFDFPSLSHIGGIRLGVASAGIKQTERDDLAVIELAPEAVCSAVFTRNAFCAAPVVLARRHLLDQSPRWLLINSGNANAGTGAAGLADALSICQAWAGCAAGNAEQVLPFSTGVIGESLPVERIRLALPALQASLGTASWEQLSQAIMTTDTLPKGAVHSVMIGGKMVTINGVAKGSGMIQPDMATMLAYIATDAAVEKAALQQCLAVAAQQSFNCITVDGDTSTNDACVLIATGASSLEPLTLTSPEWPAFQAAVTAVCMDLAEKIIRDGEGASKLIRIQVEEAASVEEAHVVAKTVAHSPLVKTAFFASDPNWGRILAAVGRSGIDHLDVSQVRIWLSDVCIVQAGMRAVDYEEADGQAVLDQNDITVRIALGRGSVSQQVLTCDLSHEYVRINAEYRS